MARRQDVEPHDDDEDAITTNDVGHVMLSYPWKYQDLFLWIKHYLETQGFCVWMDVDHMSASVLEAMAGAVEGAKVVLYCLSSAYKESEACRTEGEYAYNLRKPMIPIKVCLFLRTILIQSSFVIALPVVRLRIHTSLTDGLAR